MEELRRGCGKTPWRGPLRAAHRWNLSECNNQDTYVLIKWLQFPPPSQMESSKTSLFPFVDFSHLFSILFISCDFIFRPPIPLGFHEGERAWKERGLWCNICIEMRSYLHTLFFPNPAAPLLVLSSNWALRQKSPYDASFAQNNLGVFPGDALFWIGGREAMWADFNGNLVSRGRKYYEGAWNDWISCMGLFTTPPTNEKCSFCKRRLAFKSLTSLKLTFIHFKLDWPVNRYI